MSAITAKASSKWASRKRAWTSVYSLAVAAFSSPPIWSKMRAMSQAE